MNWIILGRFCKLGRVDFEFIVVYFSFIMKAQCEHCN